MTSQRDMQRLTEGWPDDPANFELSGFAARFRADRPALSGPALNRVADRMRDELDRLSPRPAAADAAPAWRTKFVRSARAAAAVVAGRTPATVRTLRPYALTAAAMLLAAGAWLQFRPAGATGGSARDPATRPALKGTPIDRSVPPAGEAAEEVVIPAVGE